MEWERRNTVSEDRVGELVELYQSLGFEAKVEPFTEVEGGGEVCEECLSHSAVEYFVIYTRKT